MNIIEALKSGHPIRREGVAGIWKYPPDNPHWKGVGLTREDLLAEDWVANVPERLRAWLNPEGLVVMLPDDIQSLACSQIRWRRVEWLDPPAQEKSSLVIPSDRPEVISEKGL